MTLDNYYYKQILPDANNPPIYLAGLSHTFLINLPLLGLLFHFVQKLPRNLGSLSEIMTFGIPCNQKICFRKISAIFVALYVVLIGIK